MGFYMKSKGFNINWNYFFSWILAGILLITVIVNLFSFQTRVGSDEHIRIVRKNSEDSREYSSAISGNSTNFVECKEFDIRRLLRNYYDVLSSGDRTELSKYVDEVSVYSDDFLKENETYVEQYLDIQCYYMEGMMPGTYLVAAYCYAKFYGIGTVVPVMDEFYVCSNAHGSYYISTKDVGEEIEAYNRFMFGNSQIVEMQKMYEVERDNAIKYDSAVAALLKNIRF